MSIPKHIDYDAALAGLRASYITAYPRQRLHVMRQRLRNHDFGPDRLVTSVSAVEALARCLVLWKLGGTKNSVETLYPKYRNVKPARLIVEYLKLSGAGHPDSVFGKANWSIFEHAVESRNLLAHECTYLGLDKLRPLTRAAESIFERLVELAGLGTEDA